MSAEEPEPSRASYCRETLTLSTWLRDDGEEEEEKDNEEANSGEDLKEPQRSSSNESEDSEPERPPPSAVCRKVSFADAFGLDLVSVKEFDSSVKTGPDGLESHLRVEAREGEEYYLSCLFAVPSSDEKLSLLLQQNKLELESIELLPGSSTIWGVIRVLNLSYYKAVYVRTTLDGWRSHFDLLAEYTPGSSNGETDRFSFKLTLVPPFEIEGTRVEFCLRYESSAGTFWANNGGMNYVLFCHQRGGRELKEKEAEREREAEDSNQKGKKSCLKASRKWNDAELKSTGVRGDLSEPESSKSEESEEEKTQTQHEAESRSSVSVEASRKALAERRNRRRAARLARMQDYFSQREAEVQQGCHAPWERQERGLKVAMPTSQLITPVGSDISGVPRANNMKDNNTPPILTYHHIPLLSLDWGKHTSSTAHPDVPMICSGTSPEAPEKQLTEEKSTESSTDASKTVLNGTDSSDTHTNVVDQECLLCITSPPSHTECDVSSLRGEIRNSPESPLTNSSLRCFRPEETLESVPAERCQDFNLTHTKEEALGYKYSEQPGINSETHIIQESELVWVQPESETQNRHISSQTSLSEDACSPETNPLETVQTVDAIKLQDSQGGHEVSHEECTGSSGFSDTQEKVKGDIDEAAVDTLTFTGIMDEPFIDRHMGSEGSLERQHTDEEKEPKQVKEYIRNEIENEPQIKVKTSWSEYLEDLTMGLESRRHRENEEPSQLRDESTEMISVSKNMMFDDGELDAGTEWSDKEASKPQGEKQAVCHKPEKEQHAETSEEIAVDNNVPDRECEIGSTIKMEDQGEPCEVDEVMHGRKSESEAFKDFVTDNGSPKPHSTTDTCILTHTLSITSHASESSEPFSWTESVSEGEPVPFSGTYKGFEFEETLRHRAAQDHQGLHIQEAEGPASWSRTAAPSVDTMFSRFMAWLIEFCSLGHISRGLLYTILFVIFITAYLHDLPVCLVIYLMSVCWWCRQGRKKRAATAESVD